MTEPGRGLAADSNVTPLIDVLLVLLVIFMLLPQMRFLVPVSVPPEHGQARNRLPQVVLELGADRAYSINGVTTPRNELGVRLAQIYLGRPQKLLFVRAARGWRYGEVMEAADIARGAGVQVIGYLP